ncbi:hypothetical protein N0011_32420 [Pseudomonas aeruginosa]|nr:hypothetical protein [Pseudomonas aeruginosa]MCS9649607.1 hypothetical protein [Pseudomonas aeruginosa]
MSIKDLTSHFNHWQCNSFEQCVINLSNHLDSLLEKHFPNTTPDNIRKNIISNINSELINSEQLNSGFDIITKFPGNLEITCLHYLETAISTLLVSEELYKTGNTTQAFSTLMLYALNIGQIDELLENAHACVLPSYDDERRRQIAALGGTKRSESSKPAQQKLVDLIFEKKPQNGWASKNSAANQLAKHLFVFIKNNAIPLKEDSLPETIKRWFREIPEINKAISETLKKSTHRNLDQSVK